MATSEAISKSDGLKHTFKDVTGFLEAVERQSPIYKTTYAKAVLPPLHRLASHAEQYSQSKPAVKDEFLELANKLKDFCIEVGHPDIVQENDDYKKIELYFPKFKNPLA